MFEALTGPWERRLEVVALFDGLNAFDVDAYIKAQVMAGGTAWRPTAFVMFGNTSDPTSQYAQVDMAEAGEPDSNHDAITLAQGIPHPGKIRKIWPERTRVTKLWILGSNI